MEVVLRAMGVDDEVCNEMRERLSGELGRWAREGTEDGKGTRAGLENIEGESVEGESKTEGEEIGDGGGHAEDVKGKSEGQSTKSEEGVKDEGKGMRGAAVLLGHNGFGDVGAAALSLGLWRCQTLKQPTLLSGIRHLDLTGNTIGDGGAAVVADMLCVHQHLTSLSLADNQVSGASVGVLAGALGVNTSLERLDLSRNTLDGAAMAGLCAVLGWTAGLLRQFADPVDKAVNMTLRELLLDGNALGTEGARWLGLAIGCWNLSVLSVRDCGLGDDGLVELVGGLGIRGSVGVAMDAVRVGDSPMTVAGVQRMVQTLEERRRLSEHGGAEVIVLQELDMTGSAEEVATAAVAAVVGKGMGIRTVMPSKG